MDSPFKEILLTQPPFLNEKIKKNIWLLPKLPEQIGGISMKKRRLGTKNSTEIAHHNGLSHESSAVQVLLSHQPSKWPAQLLIWVSSARGPEADDVDKVRHWHLNNFMQLLKNPSFCEKFRWDLDFKATGKSRKSELQKRKSSLASLSHHIRIQTEEVDAEEGGRDENQGEKKLAH